MVLKFSIGIRACSELCHVCGRSSVSLAKAGREIFTIGVSPLQWVVPCRDGLKYI